MLKRLHELYEQYLHTTNEEEKTKLLKQMEYLNIVIKREIKKYIESMSISEIEQLNHSYNLSQYDNIDQIKKALFTRLNVPETEDLHRTNRRIAISKLIIEIAKKHNINIKDEESFNTILDTIFTKLNAYNLRTIPAYLEYEQIDYVLSSIWWNDTYKHDSANPAFVSKVKEQYGEKAISLESKANDALVKFYKTKLTAFELEIFIALLKNKALRPDHSAKEGQLMYRIKDLNFYDQFLNPEEKVTVDSRDIAYGLSNPDDIKRGL